MVTELIGQTALGQGSAWESRAGVSGSVPSHVSVHFVQHIPIL